MRGKHKKHPAMPPSPTAPDSAHAPEVPDNEVRPNEQRRSYSVAYKLRILVEAETHRQDGTLGAFLRREGLYHATLSKWKEQQKKGLLEPKSPVKRGPAPDPDRPVRQELARTKRALLRAQRELSQARELISIQKKLCILFGLPTRPELELETEAEEEP